MCDFNMKKRVRVVILSRPFLGISSSSSSSLYAVISFAPVRDAVATMRGEKLTGYH